MGTNGDGQLDVGTADTTYNTTAAPSLIPVMQTVLPLNLKGVIQKHRLGLPCLGHVIALKVRVEQSLFRCCTSCLLLEPHTGWGRGFPPTGKGKQMQGQVHGAFFSGPRHLVSLGALQDLAIMLNEVRSHWKVRRK